MAGEDGANADGGDEAPEPYPTVVGRGEADFAVAGSEFLGYASPADSVEAAEAFVAEVRAAHPDATHVVPAYRVRTDDGVVREYASDEDEPTGSAGKPALNVLARRGLEDVAVAIARYFGGTELGVGGLARAYGRATKAAVDAAGVVERVPHERVSVVADYDDSGTVRGILESEGVAFEADYGERVRFDARTPVDEAERVHDRLRSATSGRVEIETGGG
jgi:uncharacterized YigZ family protein